MEVEEFNLIVRRRFPNWKSDVKILLEDASVLEVHAKVLEKFQVLRNWIQKNSHNGYVRLLRVQLDVFLNLLMMLYSDNGDENLSLTDAFPVCLKKDETGDRSRRIILKSYLQGTSVQSMANLFLRETSGFPLEKLSLDCPKYRDSVPPLLDTICRMKHRKQQGGGNDWCTVEIDDLDGKPRGVINRSQHDDPIVLLVHPSRGISTTKLKHFCVNYRGVTLIGYDVRTIILKLPSINKYREAGERFGNESYLSGLIQSVWPEVHVIISNPNGITVDDLKFHNSKRLTLTTGEIAIRHGIIKATVTEGTITICGRGLELQNISIFANKIVSYSPVKAFKLAVVSGRNQIELDGTSTITDITRMTNFPTLTGERVGALAESLDLKKSSIVESEDLLLFCSGETSNSGCLFTNKAEIDVSENFMNNEGSSLKVAVKTKMNVGKALINDGDMHLVGGRLTAKCLSGSGSQQLSNLELSCMEQKIEGPFKLKDMSIKVDDFWNEKTGRMDCDNVKLKTKKWKNCGVIQSTKVEISAIKMKSSKDGKFFAKQSKVNCRDYKNDGKFFSKELELTTGKFANEENGMFYVENDSTLNCQEILNKNKMNFPGKVKVLSDKFNNEGAGSFRGNHVSLELDTYSNESGGSVSASSFLDIKTQSFNNSGVTSSDIEAVLSTRSFSNNPEGNIEAEKLQVISKEAFSNLGSIGGNSVDVDTKTFHMGKEGNVNGSSVSIFCKEDFDTDGSFTTRKLSITASNSNCEFNHGNLHSEITTINARSVRNNAGWKSNKLTVKTDSLENHGSVESQVGNVNSKLMTNFKTISVGKLDLNSEVFEGVLESVIESEDMELSCQSVSNSGRISAGTLKGTSKDFENSESGSIEGSTVNLTCSGSMQNKNIISANDELFLSGDEYKSLHNSVTTSGGNLGLTFQTLKNPAIIQAHQNVSVNVNNLENESTIQSLSGTTTISGTHVMNSGYVGGSRAVVSSSTMINSGTVKSTEELCANVEEFRNSNTGVLTSNQTHVSCQYGVENKGLIDGTQSCEVDASTITNFTDASIYSNDLKLRADLLENQPNAVLASNGHIWAHVNRLVLHENSKLCPQGNLLIEGMEEGCSALELKNLSGTIDVGGNAKLKVTNVIQDDIKFSAANRVVSSNWMTVQDPPNFKIKKITPFGRMFRLRQVDEEGYQEVNPDKYVLYEFLRTVIETQIDAAQPAKIYVAGTLQLDCKSIINDKSHILASNITGTTEPVSNKSHPCVRVTKDEGTSRSTWIAVHKGRRRYGVAGPRKTIRKREWSAKRRHAPPTTKQHLPLKSARYDAGIRPPDIGTYGNAVANRENHLRNIVTGGVYSHINSQAPRKPATYEYPGWKSVRGDSKDTEVVNWGTWDNFSPGESAIFAMNQMDLKSTSVNNAGLIDAAEMSLNATSISNNDGGVISGDVVSFRAKEDITNRSGILKAKMSLKATAKNINIETTVSKKEKGTILRKSLGEKAVVFVENGTLSMDAENNINLHAAQIGAQGNVKLKAGRNVNLGAVEIGKQENVIWDKNSRMNRSISGEVGSIVKAGESVILKVGNDLTARGAVIEAGADATSSNPAVTNIEATNELVEAGTQICKGNKKKAGKVVVKAGGNVNLKAGRVRHFHDEEHTSHHSSFLTKSTHYVHDQLDAQSCLPTTVTGNSVIVDARGEVKSEGSRFKAPKEIKIKGCRLEMEASISTQSSSKVSKQSTRGFLSKKKTKSSGITSVKQESLNVIECDDGMVELSAEQENIQKSTVTARKIKASGRSVSILPVLKETDTEQKFHVKESGLYMSVSNPVYEAIEGTLKLESLMHSVESDKELMGVVAASTVALKGVNAKNAVMKNPKTLGGINATLGFRKMECHSESNGFQQESFPSVWKAEESIQLKATDGDVNIIGSQFEASSTKVTAKKNFNMLPQANKTTRKSSNSSSSRSFGVSYGTQGWGANCSMSEGNGCGYVEAITHRGSKIVSKRRTELTAENLTLLGSQIETNKFKGEIKDTLSIRSVQNTSREEQCNESFSAGISISQAGVGGNVGLNQGESEGTWKSVTRETQAGIQTGSEGFEFVASSVNLVGGFITSGKEAVDKGRNQGRTASCTFSDLLNETESASFMSSFGVNFSEGKLGASVPICLWGQGKESSVTTSGVSGGLQSIRGNSSEKTTDLNLEGLNTEVLSEGSDELINEIKQIHNPQDIQAKFAIISEFIGEVQSFVQNKIASADEKENQSEKLYGTLLDGDYQGNDKEAYGIVEKSSELRGEAEKIRKNWGAGGKYRMIANALQVALTGNVGNLGVTFAQNMTISFVQQNISKKIGEMVSKGEIKEGSASHAGLHACLAYVGACAMQQNGLLAAAASAGSCLLTNAFGNSDPNETEEEMLNKRNLISTAVAIMGFDCNPGQKSAAYNAVLMNVDNNWLASRQAEQLLVELKSAVGVMNKMKVMAKWNKVGLKQLSVCIGGFIMGVGEAGIEDKKQLLNMFINFKQTWKGLIMLLSDPRVIAQLGETLVADLKMKLNRAKITLEYGGEDSFYRLGKDVGEVSYHLIRSALGCLGALNGIKALAKCGINVGKSTVRSVRPVLTAMKEAPILATKSVSLKVAKVVKDYGTHIGYKVQTKTLFCVNGKFIFPVDVNLYKSWGKTALKQMYGENVSHAYVKKALKGGTCVSRFQLPGKNGIDAIFKYKDMITNRVKYVIVEAKTKKSGFGMTKDGRQCSNSWVTARGFRRVEAALKNKSELEGFIEAWKGNLVEKIVTRVHVGKNGTEFSAKLLNGAGYVQGKSQWSPLVAPLPAGEMTYRISSMISASLILNDAMQPDSPLDLIFPTASD